MLRLPAVDEGTKVVLHVHLGVPRSQKEKASFAELKQSSPSGFTRKPGLQGFLWMVQIDDAPPFRIRHACACTLKGSEEGFAVFSIQAVRIYRGKDHEGGAALDLPLRPVSSSPLRDGGYACIARKMEGIPAIQVVSKDRERSIVVASRNKKVLDAICDRVVGQARTAMTYFVSDSAFDRRWSLLHKQMEVIVINVDTADQAFTALTRYRKFLEDVISVPKD
jgi:hypothetical protein